NRDGCWLYLRGIAGVAVFVFPCLWLALLFGLKNRGRLVLVTLTVFGLLFWPPIETVPAAAAESRTAGTLRQLNAALESDRSRHQLPSYPRTLPHIDPGNMMPSTYRFEYVPAASANGITGSYVIQATPLRRSCGCRSFTMTQDGRLYYTSEDRPATISDE